jgi:hypothetical protein
VVIIPVATPLATLGQLGAVAPGGKPVPPLGVSMVGASRLELLTPCL